MIDIKNILKRSWKILWNYKVLWIFGILLAHHCRRQRGQQQQRLALPGAPKRRRRFYRHAP